MSSVSAVGQTIANLLRQPPPQGAEASPYHHEHHYHPPLPFNSTDSRHHFDLVRRVHCPSFACACIFLCFPIIYAVVAFISWRRLRASPRAEIAEQHAMEEGTIAGMRPPPAEELDAHSTSHTNT